MLIHMNLPANSRQWHLCGCFVIVTGRDSELLAIFHINASILSGPMEEFCYKATQLNDFVNIIGRAVKLLRLRV